MAHGAIVAAAARRLDTAAGNLQGTTLSAVGCITVRRPVRCRLTNGGVARAQPGDHAAGAPFAAHQWVTRPLHAPASAHAASYLPVPTPRIGPTSAA